MKYLKIQNKGELDIRLVALMGGTTKTGDSSKIGQFGTGLKYAIAYFMRNNIELRVFVGEEEVKFDVVDNVIGDNTFNEIYMNGVSMNITTLYGYQWKAWEAIREIWCNAMDEGGSSAVSAEIAQGLKGSTTFYIQKSDDVKNVMDNWDSYFLKQYALFMSENVSIYENKGEFLKIYKNGILVHTDSYKKSLFNYDFKDAELNELRQYRGFADSAISQALLSSNKQVIDTLIQAIKYPNKRDLFEVKTDWSCAWNYEKSKVKEIFSGYLFLSPQSESSKSSRTVIVNQGLFDLLTKCDLPCEEIIKSNGVYYGGGYVYKENDSILYKKITDNYLSEKIRKIMDDYSFKSDFIIAVPVKNNFETIVENNRLIFSADLSILSESDLRAAILVSILHKKDGDVYKAFKRLIKFSEKDNNFKNVFFGNKIN